MLFFRPLPVMVCVISQGFGKTIPPKATLKFEIELLSWEKEPRTNDEKVQFTSN